jgi:hypothetical protein
VVVTSGGRDARSPVPSRTRAETAAEVEAVRVSPPGSDNVAAERGGLIGRLVERASGDRKPLETLRPQLLERMHSPDRSDVGPLLPRVDAALSLIPLPGQQRSSWMHRTPVRRPRSWRR